MPGMAVDARSASESGPDRWTTIEWDARSADTQKKGRQKFSRQCIAEHFFDASCKLPAPDQRDDRKRVVTNWVSLDEVPTHPFQNLVGIATLRYQAGNQSAHAGAAHRINCQTLFLERKEDANMRQGARTAAGKDHAHRPVREQAQDPFKICLIF